MRHLDRPRCPKGRVLFSAAIVLGASALSIFSAPSAQAQVSFTGTYSQNFDTLASTGTTNTFTDNSTLLGWYAQRSSSAATTPTVTPLLVGTGSDNTGGLYSFGSAGSTERALGSIGSGNAAVGNVMYGVQLQNTSGGTITSVTVNFTGEEWRFGGTTGVPAVAQTLSFGYYNAGSLSTNQLLAGTYTGVSALNFTTPTITGANGGTFLDGNAAANRTSLSSTITGLNLQSGQYLWLRWTDLNDANNDHAVAIDDLSLSATVTPPTGGGGGGVAPEPGSLALLVPGLTLFGVLAKRRFRR